MYAQCTIPLSLSTVPKGRCSHRVPPATTPRPPDAPLDDVDELARHKHRIPCAHQTTDPRTRPVLSLRRLSSLHPAPAPLHSTGNRSRSHRPTTQRWNARQLQRTRTVHAVPQMADQPAVLDQSAETKSTTRTPSRTRLNATLEGMGVERRRRRPTDRGHPPLVGGASTPLRPAARGAETI